MSGVVPRRVLVVCPAYQEQESVGAVVRRLRAGVPDAAVLVVDDGSRDATAERARAAGATVLSLPFNLGVGGALRAGLVYAVRHGYDAAVQCDADGQHPVDRIPDLLAALESADVVVGARFAGAGTYTVRGPRRWAMTLLSRTMSRLHRTSLTDPTSGFRAFGPRALAVMSVELPPEYLGDTVDALVIARHHRLRVRQLPVAMLPRAGGEPSQSPLRASLYLARALVVLVLALLALTGDRLRDRLRGRP